MALPRPPLVLLSGLLCDETIWTDVAERLAAVASVSILYFDAEDSIEAMAQRVLEAAPEEFSLAGHSMGGRVALEVVRRAPRRVRRLALLNTGIHPRRDSEVASRGRLVELARRQGMSALAAEWLPPMMGASAPRRALVMPRLVSMVERRTVEGFAAQTQALLNRPDAAAVLPTIRVPTLLVSGVADTWSPLAQHQAMQDQLVHSSLTAIADAGHMAPIEQPDAVTAAMQSWLGSE
jgi:pimeloyl-ACP methyl ester carboxylesterase